MAAPFLASMAVLGLPHGAIDHWVYFRAYKKPMNAAGLAAFIAFYLIIAVVFYLFWYILPAVAALGFLLLTAYHWGEGDWTYEMVRGDRLGWQFGLYRGLLPMAVPLILYPSQYVDVLDAAASATQSGYYLFGFGWMESGVFRLSVLALVLFAFIMQYVQVRGRSRLVVESCLLFLWFLLLPPLFSIGIYFILWHSLRHIRVAARIIGPPMAGQQATVCWLQFFKLAAPFTVPALIAIAVVVSISLEKTDDWLTWIAGYLVILWCLTWPHAILVNLSVKQHLFASSNSS